MSDTPKAIWRIQSTGNTVGLVEAPDVFTAITFATISLKDEHRKAFKDGIFHIDRVGWRVGEWEKMIENIGGTALVGVVER